MSFEEGLAMQMTDLMHEKRRQLAVLKSTWEAGVRIRERHNTEDITKLATVGAGPGDDRRRRGGRG
jgi:hypothetical protein